MVSAFGRLGGKLRGLGGVVGKPFRKRLDAHGLGGGIG
jgi:hypothetical protein